MGRVFTWRTSLVPFVNFLHPTPHLNGHGQDPNHLPGPRQRVRTRSVRAAGQRLYGCQSRHRRTPRLDRRQRTRNLRAAPDLNRCRNPSPMPTGSTVTAWATSSSSTSFTPSMNSFLETPGLEDYYPATIEEFSTQRPSAGPSPRDLNHRLNLQRRLL